MGLWAFPFIFKHLVLLHKFEKGPSLTVTTTSQITITFTSSRQRVNKLRLHQFVVWLGIEAVGAVPLRRGGGGSMGAWGTGQEGQGRVRRRNY